MRYVSLVAGLALLAAPAAGQDRKPEVRAKLEGHRGGVTAVAFSRDGKFVATGSGNGVVFLWDARTGEQLARLNDHNGNTITGVALNADGTRLAAAGKGVVAVWEVTEGKAAKATAVASSASARYVGVGVAGDGSAVVHTPAWRPDVPSRVEFYPLRNEVVGRSVAGPEFFDPRAVGCAPDADGQATAVYGVFGKKDTPGVFLFGLGDVKTVTRGVPAPSKDGPHSVGYSPEGKWLGVCSGQAFAVWKVPGSQIIGGDPLMVGKLEVGGDAYAGAVGLKDVAVTAPLPVEGQPAELTFWKLGADAKKLASHKTDLADVRCLAFSPDGKTLAVGGYTDGVVQLWALGAEKSDEKKVGVAPLGW